MPDPSKRFAGHTRLLRGALFLAFVCALTPGFRAQTTAGDAQAAKSTEHEADTFQLQDGVTYATTDGQPLLCDLYLPKGKGPFPAVLYIHGGGWRDGTRKQLHRQAEFLANHGIAGMAIEYRLAPAHPFPAALDDAKSALIWLRSHAAQYNIDPGHIAVVGSSAGGHLAAMLGVQSLPADPAHIKTNVQAVISFNGIYDLSHMPPSTMVSDFAGGACTVVPQKCTAASPQEFVRSGLPPFLILHGTADKTAPYEQATEFVKALQSSHDKVRLFTAEGAPHTFWIQPKWASETFNAMYSFLSDSLSSGVGTVTHPRNE